MFGRRGPGVAPHGRGARAHREVFTAASGERLPNLTPRQFASELSCSYSDLPAGLIGGNVFEKSTVPRWLNGIFRIMPFST